MPWPGGNAAGPACRIGRRGGLVYRSELGGLYRIPKLKDRVYLIEGRTGRTRD